MTLSELIRIGVQVPHVVFYLNCRVEPSNSYTAFAVILDNKCQPTVVVWRNYTRGVDAPIQQVNTMSLCRPTRKLYYRVSMCLVADAAPADRSGYFWWTIFRSTQNGQICQN